MDTAAPQGAETEVEHADYPDRLDEVSTSLEALYTALAGQEGLDAVLGRLADTTVRAIPDADVVTVTIFTEGHLRTSAATSERVSFLDQQQHDEVAGPYRDAIEQRKPLRVGLDDETRQRWPEFAQAADTAGIRAYVSAPVFLAVDPQQQSEETGGELIAMLNIYGDSPDAFDPFDEALLRLLSTTVSAAVTSARRHEHTRTYADQLQQALGSRAEIDQAKGVLMAVHRIDADAAFQRLVSQSQQTNTKLHEVARRLLGSL